VKNCFILKRQNCDSKSVGASYLLCTRDCSDRHDAAIKSNFVDNLLDKQHYLSLMLLNLDGVTRPHATCRDCNSFQKLLVIYDVLIPLVFNYIFQMDISKDPHSNSL